MGEVGSRIVEERSGEGEVMGKAYEGRGILSRGEEGMPLWVLFSGIPFTIPAVA
jgi:hypothetical protein